MANRRRRSTGDAAVSGPDPAPPRISPRRPAPPPASGAGKEDWRRWARRVRRSGVPEGLSSAAASGIAGWLSGAGAPAGMVVLYLPLPDEVDVTPVTAETARVYAVTRTPSHGPLTLHPADSPLEKHHYGFRQPVASAPVLSPDRVGVVLVPGLLFDRRGGRLGRGKGYYDRFLAALPADALRVGVALEHLVIESLPTEPHDVPMTHLATENGVRKSAAGGG